MATVTVQLTLHGAARLAANRTSCGELEGLDGGLGVARELDAMGELVACPHATRQTHASMTRRFMHL